MSESPHEVKKKPPVHEINLGLIKGLIWKIDTPNGPKLFATYERLYVDIKEEDSKDKWKSTGFYDATQSLTHAKVAELCAIWMFRNQPKRSDEEDSDC